MKNKLALACLSSMVLISGCSTTIENPNTYTKVSLRSADIMPTKEELKSGSAKIVIFTPDDSGIKLAGSAKAGHSIATALEKYIAVTGAEIVDRNIAQQLKSEIQLAEMKGKSEYQGPNVADYAVTGTVAGANVGSNFNEARQWKDSDGYWHETPATCTYRAQVKANMTIYKLPALSFSKTITVEGSVSTTEDARSSYCRYSQNAQESLVRQAATKAVKNARTGFQNYFAPKAFVLEHRKNDDLSIFKISKGSTFGFVPESEISFYCLEKSENPISGEESVEESFVTKGTVSNRVGKNHAWIVIKDEEKAEQIKLGDYVKVKYAKSWYE